MGYVRKKRKAANNWPLYSDLAVLRPIARSLDCNTPIWRRSGRGPIWPSEFSKTHDLAQQAVSVWPGSGLARSAQFAVWLRSGLPRSARLLYSPLPDWPDCPIDPIALFARSARLLYSPDRPDGFICPIGPIASGILVARSARLRQSPDWPDRRRPIAARSL